MLKLLNKIIPKWIQKKVYNALLSLVKKISKMQTGPIPQHAISKETIKNSRLLLNRLEMLKLLPKHGVVAELGVDKGGFSEQILNICEPSKLHLVDLWDSERYNQNKRKSVENKFKTQISSGQVEINIGYSTDVGQKFQDNYFDWIYIDTDHSYKTTIKELEIWKSKVKEDGVIAGHDYVIANWDGMVRYGVIEAVYEFCSKYNWEILYITMEHDYPPSFAIKKIKD